MASAAQASPDIEQITLELEHAVAAAMTKRLGGEPAEEEIRLVSTLTVKRIGLAHEAMDATGVAER